MKFGFPVFGNSKIKTSIETAHRLGFDYIEMDLNPPCLEMITQQKIKIIENLKENYKYHFTKK